MITFEERTGPRGDVEYPQTSVPQWWLDAKFGVFVHWGLYSIPAWATPEPFECRTEADEYAHHRYAEWYANTVAIEGSPTWRRHRELCGSTSYEDLADRWKPAPGAGADLARRAAAWGAEYLVLTTKHHDGFCLWDTATTDFSAPRRGPGRDLVAEVADGCARHDIRFGAYFSGALDWHHSDFGPITSNEELFTKRRNDPEFARLAAAQLEEVVDVYGPAVLWNDIDWPDAGKGEEDYGLAALFTRYFAAVPDGVVDDRWGVPFHGHLTREYRETGVEAEPWEATRGVGRSFGLNRAEDPAHTLTGVQAIRLLVTTAAAGGNLLLNIGPDADGNIVPEQVAVLDELGAWLAEHGRLVKGSRAWHPELVGGPLVCVHHPEETPERLTAFAVDPAQPVTVPSLLQESAFLLDGQRLPMVDGELHLPDAVRGRAVVALEVHP